MRGGEKAEVAWKKIRKCESTAYLGFGLRQFPLQGLNEMIM